MPYRYPLFGDVPLPLLNPRYQHDTVSGESPFLRTPDGYYIIRGGENGKPLNQTHAITASFVGQSGEYLVDETGDILVDETGDPLIAGTAAQMLRAQVTALREKILQWDVLWRQNLDNDALTWKRCQFIALREPQTWNDLFAVEVTSSFATIMANWHAEDATTVSDTATDSEALGLVVENSGMQVDDAVLTITCNRGTISALAITATELGIDLTWTGTLSNGETLTIDASGSVPPAGAVDAYAGFEFGENHTQDGWLSIPRGLYVFYVTVTGGDADVTLSFYEQEP